MKVGTIQRKSQSNLTHIKIKLTILTNTRLLNYGVDCIEIYSETDDVVKQEIINKVRAFAKKNKQIIPIMYTLSYFHVYIINILNDVNEYNFSPNSVLYIADEIKDIQQKIEDLYKKKEKVEEKVDDYTIIATQPFLIFNNSFPSLI